MASFFVFFQTPSLVLLLTRKFLSAVAYYFYSLRPQFVTSNAAVTELQNSRKKRIYREGIAEETLLTLVPVPDKTAEGIETVSLSWQ